MRERHQSGVFPAARVSSEIVDRLWCQDHKDHHRADCFGCRVARGWRRAAERGELPEVADAFNGVPL